MRDDVNERAELPAELAPTHEALTHLAAAWSATMPSAERLAAFARQLPTQQPHAHTSVAAPSLRERPPERRDPAEGHPNFDAGRLAAGLAAAVVIVGLLAATLLRLAPGRTGGAARATPTLTAAPTATPTLATEEASKPPSGAWTTANQARLVAAPSDGRIVYELQGATARVSSDGGATWRALALPTFSQAHVATQSATLAVGDTDPRLVLLSMQLTLSSSNPADCPSGSQLTALAPSHGGILASGNVSCYADFISHTGGASWTPIPAYYTALNQSVVWQLGSVLYGERDDVDHSSSVTFPLVGVRLLASRDGGQSWSYADTTLKRPSVYVCSVLPVAATSALYAVTFTSPCHSGDTGEHTVWRSMDDGATWSQMSSVQAGYAELVAASPAGSHAHWLYMLAGGYSSVAQRLLVSEDGGASWTRIPAPPQASIVGVSIQPINDALSDGSVVVVAITQTTGASGAAPGKATFYAWRPGDSAWRTLTTPLEAISYSSYFSGSTAIFIAHGGRGARDTLYVLDSGLLPNGLIAATHMYPIR